MSNNPQGVIDSRQVDRLEIQDKVFTLGPRKLSREQLGSIELRVSG